jgi:hypothetical protein
MQPLRPSCVRFRRLHRGSFLSLLSIPLAPVLAISPGTVVRAAFHFVVVAISQEIADLTGKLILVTEEVNKPK